MPAVPGRWRGRPDSGPACGASGPLRWVQRRAARLAFQRQARDHRAPVLTFHGVGPVEQRVELEERAELLRKERAGVERRAAAAGAGL